MAEHERFDPAVLTKAAEDTLAVRRVFGEAYQRDGVLVVRLRRNQLHRVRAEYGEVADILLPLVKIPAVIGVRLRAIAQLVPANWIGRCGRNI